MAQEIQCPNCGSNQFYADKKGFSGKKAVAGAVATGGLGLLAGTLGSNKIVMTCLACGHQFGPGQGIYDPTAPRPYVTESNTDLELSVVRIIQKDGLLAAILAYQKQQGTTLEASKTAVSAIAQAHGITGAKSGGCMGVLLIIIFPTLIYLLC